MSEREAGRGGGAGAGVGGGSAGGGPDRGSGEGASGDNDPGGNGSVLTEIDHVAIAVVDLDAAVSWYRTMFGATVAHRERVERDGVEEALIKVADSYIQLLMPTRPDSPVARYLERHGEGLHHVGYRVTDVAAALATLQSAGARVVDASPRPGSRGTMVAFVHPKASFGTLIELVQE